MKKGGSIVVRRDFRSPLIRGIRGTLLPKANEMQRKGG
jgi:hypothetical protein